MKLQEPVLQTPVMLLREQALFLSPISQEIADAWAELYLSVFGRRAFFSETRVRRIFKELVDIFVGCLKEGAIDVYFQNLKERGEVFCRLGVPFEEVIISLHLFEEVCVRELLANFQDRSKLADFIIAMEELHSEGLATFAGSYFDTFKTEIEKSGQAMHEENQGLREEVLQLKNSMFARTAKELGSMQLLLSGINHKLRKRVYQLSRLHKIQDALDNESHLPVLMKVATLQFLELCPPNTEVFFGLLDETRQQMDIHFLPAKTAPECQIAKTIYFSELSKICQDALYDETKKYLCLKGFGEMPESIVELVRSRNLREFLWVPIRRYGERFGFVLLCAEAADFFTKQDAKFYQRIGQVVSRALFNVIVYTKIKRHDEFVSLLGMLDKKIDRREELEGTLDFCLGSLIRILGAERASVMVYDAAKEELRVCAAKGFKVYPISGLSIRWGEGVAGVALKESKIVSINRLKEHPKPVTLVDRVRREKSSELKVKSLLCLPLVEESRPLGVVNISTISFYRRFEPSEIDMAHQISRRLCGILKNID